MEQITIFDELPLLKISKPIRLIELFAGYGSQALALKYLGANFAPLDVHERDVVFAALDCTLKKARQDFNG